MAVPPAPSRPVRTPSRRNRSESPGVNLAVLCGPCSGPAEIRVLESGTRLASLAVRCPAGAAARRARPPRSRSPSGTPPAWVETLAAGDVVVVVGRMRRRFYQRPGGVGSRVDVEAEFVGRARDRRRIERGTAGADQALEALG